MNENKRTIIYGAVAVVLLIIAIFSSPGRITPEAFMDQGEVFFPDFTDPNKAATLEVVGYDQSTGTPRAFKVTFKGSAWTIPSHHDYPADARDRLARTAAGVIGIKKDEFRTNNVSDHEACGVIDPLDETAGISGRGQRITISGQSDEILADVIIGTPIEMRPNYRYVRIPGSNRVYAAEVDMELSTRFQDWIDTDLLRLRKSDIDRVVLRDYSVNERTLSIDDRDNLVLTRQPGRWAANRMSAGQSVDSTAIDELLSSLEGLTIVGVRPKPQGLSANLKVAGDQKELTQEDFVSLRNKGFYLSNDGRLLSNEGELQVMTNYGVNYTLRFGEVVYGSGLAVSAGGEDGSRRGDEVEGENRYLFITADYDPGYLQEPPKPTDTSYLFKEERRWDATDRANKLTKDRHDFWVNAVARGPQAAAELSNRFADWYYVISSDSYDKIHLKRSDLVANR
ncbi:MAG: DUF4340 domain-containing protein [Candidatus Zixiibacteriota bacterium]|nr:MAG: DUF4340 domain-containing protein [candidate division Zixibacteria bacterium]